MAVYKIMLDCKNLPACPHYNAPQQGGPHVCHLD